VKYFDEEDTITEYEKQLQKKDNEIERLKEDYMILQNASDEVEEEKDKEIERLNNIIKEVREYIEKNTDNTNFLEVPSKELLEIIDKINGD